MDWLQIKKYRKKDFSDDFIKPQYIYGKNPNRAKNLPKEINAPDEDLAWMFGFYIGDGNTTKNHKVSFTFSSSEIEYIEKLL